MDFPKVKGKLERNYPLKRLSSWKIGGPGEIVYWPDTAGDLVQVVKWCREQGKPFFLLGRGSNVLLPDEGLKGLVIVTTNLKDIDWREDSVRVEAGYPLMLLSREAAARGLRGLEFACGIPGTIGAAVALNAGAYGAEIGQLVESVQVLTPGGEQLALDAEGIDFAYRNSSLITARYLVLSCLLRFKGSADPRDLQETMDRYMAKRASAQPLKHPNAGSVFRNPPGDSAGRLIEAAGWKGRRIGDAEVSMEHANFIINKGKAESADVLRLIREIQEDVFSKFGIELQTEIKILAN